MKKLISYLLIVMLVFSGSATAWAEGENPVNKKEYYENVAVGLGIVDAKLRDSETVTRSDFAMTLVKLMNESLTNTSVTSYTDVPSGTKESAAIEFLKNEGIMVGMGEGIFKPDDPILYEHAIRLILKVTKNIKEFNGQEIISETNYERMTKGISLEVGGMVTYDILTRLIYNSLEMKVMPPSFDKIGTATMASDGDETVLKYFFNMARVSGVLETDIHSSVSELTVNGNTITIDGKKYKSATDYNDSLGFKVDCFFDIDSNEVVFLTTHPDNEVITVRGDDLTYSPTNRIYTYSHNGSAEHIEIKSTTDIAYNDRVMTESDNPADMVPTNGYVMFINNDKDGDVDVIRIMQYTDIYISGKSTDETKATIFENGGVSAIISTEPGEKETIIKDASGKVVTVKGLREGVVASVLGDYVGTVSNGSTINARRVVISSDSISGKISKFDASENMMVVDGEECYLNGRFKAPSLGNKRTYTFYLNFMGKVAAMGNLDRSDLPMAVGYVIEATVNGEDKCVVKMLTYENETVKYTCAEKVKFEGLATHKDQNIIKNLFSVNAGLVGFTVNDDKELNRVVFPSDYSLKKPTEIPQDFGLYCIGKSSNDTEDGKYEYFQHYKSFYGKLTLTEDTIMFVLPESGTVNATNCKVEPIENLVHEKKYDLDGYVFDRNSVYCDVIVVRAEVNPEANSKSSLGVVKKISNTLNEDDEVVEQVIIAGQDGEFELQTKDSNVLTNAKKYDDDSALGRRVVVGDTVLYAVNSEQEISDIKVVYDKTRDKVYATDVIGDGNHEDRDQAFMEALVYSVDPNFIRLVDINEDVKAATLDKIEMMPFERVSIFVLEEDAGKVIVKKGSISDVNSYVKNGEASRVLFKASGFIGYFMLIIK